MKISLQRSNVSKRQIVNKRIGKIDTEYNKQISKNKRK